MFLATTAIEEFWDTSQKILFLGEWCKIYNRRDCWTRLDYETQYYHWNDRTKLYSDYKYLDEIYEKFLKLLAEKLNSTQNVDYPLKYWRIIIGWWLRYFIEVLFDRYQSIINASESYNINNTWIIKNNYDQFFVPDDFKQFEHFICSDEYNLFLYSKIIELSKTVPFEYKNMDINKFYLENIVLKTEKRKKNYKKVIKEAFLNLAI